MRCVYWQRAELVKSHCNGDNLRAGKSSWQLDYRVSDRQQHGKVARFWTRGRAIRVSYSRKPSAYIIRLIYETKFYSNIKEHTKL
jgi:hypothetical protein